MSNALVNSALHAALHRVLRPLVRLMLAMGLTLPMAIEVMKRVFVEVAEQDFQLEGKAATDSRISLLSGVHRKDVKRLRNLPDIESDLPAKVSLGAQVVATWISSQEWRDDKGRPRPLPRLARVGGDRSFETLVASVSRDIRPRPILDEWLRLGVVSINESDEVVLSSGAFVPEKGSEEKLAYFGHNLGDHAAAATDNVLGGKAPWFERSVHHQRLTAEQVNRLRQRASELGMTLLTELHTMAGETPETAASAIGDDERFTCGVYFYSMTDKKLPAADT
jgi:hypothetical protein